jgi:FkbM family methyltransferase
MSELPAGKNLSQHGPAGEWPPGFHPSQYWDPLVQQEAGLALYGRFCKPGDLVFDIGANVGQRTGWFLELGCRVVAVEPQPAQAAFIPAAATRILAAVADKTGRAPFYPCTSSNYLSTLNADYVQQVHEQPGIGGNIYGDAFDVDVVTMDDLIASYGVPAFAKIDVEGGEVAVLAGLSQPLQALSFECHHFAPWKADLCIARLGELGDYEYAYSPLESFRLEQWPPAEAAVFGDVYATLRS